MLTRLYNLEFIENGPTERKLETSISREDKFIKILQEGAKLRNGYYQVPLPFKDPFVNLPNNRCQARQKFSYLKKKFSKNDQFIFFYVDGLLKSFPTVNEAVKGIKQLQELCSRGGFNPTKFINNKQEVIKLIPDHKRKPNIRNELVTFGNPPQEKALGVKWGTQNDTLGFYINWLINL